MSDLSPAFMVSFVHSGQFRLWIGSAKRQTGNDWDRVCHLWAWRSVMAKDWRGVPLGMHRMNPECLDSDRSGPSIAFTILLRGEPDEEEEEEDRKEEDDDGDEDDGYSE
jgi:hypothetical protein